MANVLAIKERLCRHYATDPNTGCWLWFGSLDKRGYAQINVNGTKSAHRVSYEEYVDKIPKGIHVLHKCDVPNCINPDHLFLGTVKDNMQDKSRKGRCHNTAGESHPRSKLKEYQVLEIRRLCAEGNIYQKEIANMFNISKEVVNSIHCRRTWRHI